MPHIRRNSCNIYCRKLETSRRMIHGSESRKQDDDRNKISVDSSVPYQSCDIHRDDPCRNPE